MRVIWGIILGGLIAGAAVIGYIYLNDQKPGALDGLLVDSDAPTVFDDRAYFAKLQSENYRTDTMTDFDLDALIATVPDEIAITYASIDNDATSNGVIVRDLRITAKDNPDAGIKVATASFWGVDSDALLARLNGQRLDETISVLDRLEFTNIEAFGLGSVYQPLLDATSKVTSNLIGDVIDDPLVAKQVSQATKATFDKYDMSAGKLVLSKLVLHPYRLNLIKFPEPEDPQIDTPQIELEIDGETAIVDAMEEEFSVDYDDGKQGEEFVHIMQTIAAIGHAISFEDYALYDAKADVTYRDGAGDSMSMNFDIPLSGYKGYDRGDIDAIVMRDYGYAMSMDVPLDETQGSDFSTEPAETFAMEFSGNVESYLIRDLRLSKINDHLARGVFPDKSITDLLSLGYWSIENEKMSFGDLPFYSMKKTTADLRGFHGILPAKVKINVDDASYNFVNFIRWMDGIMAAVPDTGEDVAAQREMISGIIKVMEDNDFVDPDMDLNLAWNWDPDNGGYKSDGRFAMENFLNLSGDSDLDLPTYDALMANVSDDMSEEDFEAIGAAFEQMFAFNRAKLKLTDKGGIEKSFAMAVGIAELIPQDAGAGFLVGAKPDDLRVMAATTMRLSAGQMSQVFPPAKDYILAMADFVSKGGSLIATWEPEVPVTAALLKAKQEDGSAADPAAAVEIFGFDLEHKGSGADGD